MLRRLSLRWLIPLTLVVLLLPACSDSAGDIATTVAPPETATTAASTTSPTLSPAEAIATVEALQVAYNAYDPDAALVLFAEDANDDGANPPEQVWYRFKFDMPEVAGTQSTLSECEADDHGNVTCHKTWEETLLGGKAGIVYSCMEEYHFDAEGLITLRMPEWPEGKEDNEAFEAALGEWMVTAHPEAYERFYVSAFNTTNAEAWHSPEGVAELSPLIDEFVAQSDDYPLGS